MHKLGMLAASARAALSMFSRIPVGAASLDGRGMKYAIAFWPLVGIAQGIAAVAWGAVALAIHAPALLLGVVLALLPVLVNGGIHIDGLCDTADALAAHASRERSLAIMADAHVGSFAVLTLAVHLILACVFASCVAWTPMLLCALGCTYVLSRSLAGYTVVRWPSAHEGGLASTFAEHARGTACPYALLIVALAATVALCLCGCLSGILACLGAACVLARYRHLCTSRFGGVTGDTSGWFVQTCELVCLGAFVAGGLL